MVYVSASEFKRIRAIAAGRKAKRDEKRETLPWGIRAAAAPVVKRKAKTRRQLLRERLDALWSFYIKLRDRIAYKGLCRICGTRAIAVAYHIVPRGDDATRWDTENGCGACAPCNRGEQLNRSAYRTKHVEIFGAAKVEYLERQARTTAKFSIPDLETKVMEIKEAIAACTLLTK